MPPRKRTPPSPWTLDELLAAFGQEILGRAVGSLEELLRSLLPRPGQPRGNRPSALPRGADPYQVLGLRPEAPRVVIEAAYRALAKASHPDTSRGDGETMREINAAMVVIRRQRGWK